MPTTKSESPISAAFLGYPDCHECECLANCDSSPDPAGRRGASAGGSSGGKLQILDAIWVWTEPQAKGNKKVGGKHGVMVAIGSIGTTEILSWPSIDMDTSTSTPTS